MRIRTVKPEFFLHFGLFKAEKETGFPVRVAFEGLWGAADREGRFKWEPERLKVQILPYDEVDFSRVLDALTTRGFLVKYASEGSEFGWIPSFKKHQFVNPREVASELPSPQESLQVSDSESVDESMTRATRVADACPTRLSCSLPLPNTAPKGEFEGKSLAIVRPGSGRRPADLNECLARASMIGMCDQDAKDWFRDSEACGWCRGDGTPFDNWVRQMCIARDKNREKEFRGGNGKPTSILDLKTAIQIKEERATAMKEKYSTQGPVSTDWSDQSKRKEFFDLKKEIKTLKARIEKMV